MGIKRFAFVRRRAGMSSGDFHAYWRDDHARRIHDRPELLTHVRRFELNHRLVEDDDREQTAGEMAGVDFDGVAGQWFANLPAWVELLGGPAHAEMVEPDRATFLDPTRIRFVLSGPPTVVVGD